MNLEEKFNILLNKMNFGHYDDVIFETSYLIKKFPKQEALYNLLALTYQAKGEYDKSIELLNDALKRSKNKTTKNFPIDQIDQLHSLFLSKLILS